MTVNYQKTFEGKFLQGQEDTYLDHAQYLGGMHALTLDEVEIGMILQFMYQETNRVVLCTHPGYPNKKNLLLLHGITLHMTSRSEMMYIMSKMPAENDPLSFYQRVLKSVVAINLSYRTYFLSGISQLVQVEYSFTPETIEQKRLKETRRQNDF